MLVHDEPIPRLQPEKYQLIEWLSETIHPLAPRGSALDVNIVYLLEQRQTRREFNRRLESTEIGDFLWLACRNRSFRTSRFGFEQESRSHPSAGAMHPIHVLLCQDGGPWMRYDPKDHALCELKDSVSFAAEGRRAAGQLVDIDQGVLIGLVAEPGKTQAKYEHHESLVWRDAGVVLGYMSLIAEALGLAFCPLGITGRSYLTGFIPDANKAHAVGLAVLGAV